jgi:arginine/lysine/ornithine decarboxylase
MASVEYAVKYPRNQALEEEAEAFLCNHRVFPAEDWTKICAVFGKHAFEVEKILQGEGIYAEFCDGNAVCFYLSPATEMQDFIRLKSRLEALFVQFPLSENMTVDEERIKRQILEDGVTEWVALEEAEGEICASICGLFPPCTPLLSRGEKISAEKIGLLQSANHTFGLKNGKIAVWKGAKKE